MNRYIKVILLLSILLSAILICMLFSQSKEKQSPAPISDTNPPPEAVSGDITASALDEYLLIAEGEYLNLYFMDGEPSLKHSEHFDSFLLPSGDIAILSQGIKFQSIEKAYEVMEGFIN